MTINDLPLYLKAEDVAKVLPIKKTKIYELMKDPTSGAFKMGPKILLWPRDKFLAYIERWENQGA